MLMNTKEGWKRLATVKAIPSLPTQHPVGFGPHNVPEWKKLGYPSIEPYLDAWIKADGKTVPVYIG